MNPSKLFARHRPLLYFAAFLVQSLDARSQTTLSAKESTSGQVTVDMVLGSKAAPNVEDLKKWSIEDRVGQLMMVGYRNLKQIEELRPGGVVLFSWSLKGPKATRELIKDIKNEASLHLKTPLFVSTDQEGGKVLRISKGMTRFPDAAAIGALDDPYTAFRVGRAMGTELASLGLNMNFAPVLDLGNARSFLENRIWGEDPARVVKTALAFIRGLETARILAVPKHFPGHGGTLVDSHHQLPRILKTFEELLKEDLIPFEKAVNHGVLAVMSAHVEIPAVDRGPASLSKRFLSEILRKEIGFRGIIITDDIEMNGADGRSDADEVELAIKALEAGNDQILVVWSQQKQRRIYRGLVDAVKSGRLKEKWLNEKVARILWVKSHFIRSHGDQLDNPFWQENLRLPSSIALVDEITEKAIRWLVGPQQEITGAFARRWKDAWAVFVPSEFVKKQWSAYRPQDKIYVVPQKATGNKEIKRIESTLRNYVKKEIPTVFMTPPRALLDERLFKRIVSVLSLRTRSKELDGPVLWVHQGMRPLEINWKPEQYRIGIVSLYSTSSKSLEAFKDFLRAGKL